MRSYYYALDTRPVCPKCRQVYAGQIARGTGSKALVRAALYGGGAALASALLLGGIILVIGVARIFLAIAVGFAVGKAINAATGGYLATKYRIMAVVFTYFAIGFGSLSPVIKALAEVDEPAQVVEVVDEDPDILPREPLTIPTTKAPSDDPWAELDATIAEMERENAPPRSANVAAADQISAASFGKALGMFAILVLTLPLLAGLSYGIHGAAITVLAVGYGVYKAWDITGNAVAHAITGPFKVGTGPISHTI
jgi:hypothetical protein